MCMLGTIEVEPPIGRDDERQSAPAAGQWCEEFDEHLWPCPWHHHIHKDNLPEK